MENLYVVSLHLEGLSHFIEEMFKIDGIVLTDAI